MGRLIVSNAVSVNGAFEAPEPEPAGWLVLGEADQGASLDMLHAADAMLLGRKTYEGLAAVWPELAHVPGMETYAARVNAMPKYVASTTLTGPLEWNATLLEGDLGEAVTAAKARHDGDLFVSGMGQLARWLLTLDLVDELVFWVSPTVWPAGPRLLEGVGPVRLELLDATPYDSGVVRLRYRPGREVAPAADG
jgi:dihydrofolate reductase